MSIGIDTRIHLIFKERIIDANTKWRVQKIFRLTILAVANQMQNSLDVSVSPNFSKELKFEGTHF